MKDTILYLGFYILSVLFGIFVGIYNAYVFKLHFGGKEKTIVQAPLPTVLSSYYNRMVHTYGAWVRTIWFIMVSWMAITILGFPVAGHIILLNGIMLWPIYNFIYNSYHGHPWYYLGTKASGTSSRIDIALGRANYTIMLLLFLLFIFWFPLYKSVVGNHLDGLITIVLACFSFHFVIRFHYKHG